MRSLILLLLASTALASGRGDEIEQETKVITGDTHIAGDSSRAIGVGGSDYDIAAGTCRVHQGGFTVAIATFDEFCQGMAMIDRGMVRAGVKHLCRQSPVGENYDSYHDCEREVSDIMARAEPPPETDAHIDEEREYHHEQQQRVAQLEARFEQRIAEIEKRPQPRPRVVRETVVEQRPLLTDDQVRALKFEK